VQERESESKSDKLKEIRRDVVMRYWGSETELTRDAYRLVNEGHD
jgi:hypothetical protein